MIDFSKFDYKYFDKIAESFSKLKPGNYPINESTKEKFLYHIKIYTIMRPEYLPVVAVENDKLIIKE